MQRDELKLSREENARAREQHKIIAEANKEQAIELVKQREMATKTMELNLLKARMEGLIEMFDAHRFSNVELEQREKGLMRKELKEVAVKYANYYKSM